MNQDLVRQQPGGLADPGQQGDDIVTYARWVVESGLFGRGITQAQAGLKMLVGRELGIQPLAAVRNIYIFEADGRPVVILDATLMGAMIRASGRYDYDVERNDDSGTVLAMYRVEPAMPRTFLGRESFTIEDARRRKLTEKRGPWTQGYAKEMMFARAMSRLIDHHAPDLLLGLSLPVVSQDEAEEMPMGHDQRKAIFANLKEVRVESREQRLRWASDVLGRDVPTFSDGNPGCPTRAEASRLLDWFDETAGPESGMVEPKDDRVAGADEPARQVPDKGNVTDHGAADDWIPAPAAASDGPDWTEPEGAGEDASPGAGDTVGREVPTNPAPAEHTVLAPAEMIPVGPEHVVQTLVAESDAMAEYRDIRRQLKAERRNAAAIATTREFLIGLGDEFKGMSEEAAVAELDRRGQLDQLTALLIRRFVS